jgi:hypothetical protein
MNKFTFQATLRKICTFKYTSNCNPQAVMEALTVLFMLELYPAAEADAFCETSEGSTNDVILMTLYNNQTGTNLELYFTGTNTITLYNSTLENLGFHDKSLLPPEIPVSLSLDDTLVLASKMFD